MHIYLIIICILFTVIFPLQAYPAEWKKLGNVYIHDMIVKVYVDSESLQNVSDRNGYRNLWVKFELPKNIKSSIDKKEYRVRKEKYYYHCDQKLFAVSHMILLDRDDEVVYDSGSYDPFSEQYNESWKLISPNSGPDLIYRYICSEKIKSTSAEDSSKDISAKDILPKPIIISEDDESGALDIKKIRWAKHEDHERVVIDIYKGKMPIKKPVQYNVTELEGKNKLIVELNDYNSFSAEFPILEESSFIGKMYKVKSQKENNVNNYKLHIDLKKPVKYEVFELENPGRVVIDITEK